MTAAIIPVYDLAFISGAPGTGEIILLFIIILLLFGPKKLPSIARSIGKTIDELRKASNDFKDQVMKIDDIPSVDITSDDITEEDPYAYGLNDDGDDYGVHIDDSGHEEEVSADTESIIPPVGEDQDASIETSTGTDGEDSRKDDNA